ncbi:MAG: DUF1559 domain-containing protein [Gemmataceae bacterium]
MTLKQSNLLAALIVGLFCGTGCGKKSDPAPQAQPQAQQAADDDGKEQPKNQGKTDALAFIPGNALGFMSVQVGRVWQSAPGKELQKLAALAPQMMEGMSEELGLEPADIEYAGFVLMRAREQPLTFVVAAKKLDREKVAEQLVPEAEEKSIAGKKILVEPERRDDLGDFMALHFLNDKSFIKGAQEQLKEFLAKKPEQKGLLSPALGKTSQHQVTACLDLEAMITQVGEEPSVAGPLAPLVKARIISLTADVGSPWKVRAEANFPDATAAAAGKTAVDNGLKLLKGQIFLIKRQSDPKSWLGMFSKPIEQIETGLNQTSVKLNGTELAVAIDVPLEIKIDKAMLAQVAERTARAADRARSANNIKQMNLAIHNWVFTKNGLPPSAICDKNGKPLLSWRVLLLPYLEQEELYKQFKLDESWDSPHNKKLLEKMPAVYALPGVKSNEPGLTHYRFFTGPGTLFPGKVGEVKPAIAPSGKALVSPFTLEMRDGTSNTISIVPSIQAVPWTRPDDFDTKMPLAKLYDDGTGSCIVGMMDGRVTPIELKKIKETTLKLLIDPDDGQVIPNDFE